MNPLQMEQRLRNQFPDADILVEDLTGTQNHFEVRMASQVFFGKSRIECQRTVMDVFADELKSGEVHALTIKTLIKEKL